MRLDRRSMLIFSVAGVLFLALAVAITGDGMKERDLDEEPAWKEKVENQSPEKATLAGGCFWCIEQIYDDRKGVEEAISGYAGGTKENATYKKVVTGKTDHREAVRVKYYPSIISYGEILDVFWRNIDPTDPGGQFSDRGPQYTTAIYYHNQEQKQIAEKSRKNLSEGERFEQPIVTEIEEYTTFFRAEDRHQNYSEKRTTRYKAYKRLSGRKGFIEKVWDAAP